VITNIALTAMTTHFLSVELAGGDSPPLPIPVRRRLTVTHLEIRPSKMGAIRSMTTAWSVACATLGMHCMRPMEYVLLVKIVMRIAMNARMEKTAKFNVIFVKMGTE
jgi:hypothetical protein